MSTFFFRIGLVATLVTSLFQQCAARHLRMSHFSRHRRNHAQSRTMLSIAPYYHSTDQIHSELSELSSRCKGMNLQTVEGSDGSVSIDVVTIKDPDASPVNKNFLLFGEHSRELISPESGLHFIKTLCGENEELKSRAQAVLKDSEFQVVVNANPNSRKKVEQGDFCLRVNENGVDLNRNWDEKWQADAVLDASDTNPGPSAFSEQETQIFKNLVSEYKPTNFLTVHSGTRGMYMPWAYDMEHLATRNQPQMMQILKKLDANYCECPYGAAGKEVGYSCPGTCLDWVYDQLQTPYSFAFEIYVGEDMDDGLKERWEEKLKDGDGAFYQLNSHLAHKHFRDIFEKHESCFVQLKSQHKSRHLGMSPEECFAQFNPDSEERFHETVNKWTKAYLDMAQMVATNLKGGSNATMTNSSM